MLQDALGRTITSLRVSVTDRCNLRCRYCMPEEGVEFVKHTEILRYEEIERIIQVALRLGIDKVRLTGGEPLVRKGILDFIRDVGTFQGLRKFSLTTNGILLPEYALPLKEAGVGYINISLDTLNEEKFHTITRINHLNTVLNGIQAAKDAGFHVIKVNVVSVRGVNDDELFDFVDFADQHDLTIRFIEYMPFSGNEWDQSGFIPSWELKRKIEEYYTLLPLSDDPYAAAKTFRIPHHNGRIGFISSVSESFCERCNRLRLTADGHLLPCLHGNVEIDIKTPLRQGAHDDDLAALFQEAADRKPTFHQDFLDSQYHNPVRDREMVRIGG